MTSRAGEAGSAISVQGSESAGTRARDSRKNGPALLVRMPDYMHEMLAMHAESRGISMALAARLAIKHYLQDQPDYIAPY